MDDFNLTKMRIKVKRCRGKKRERDEHPPGKAGETETFIWRNLTEAVSESPERDVWFSERTSANDPLASADISAFSPGALFFRCLSGHRVVKSVQKTLNLGLKPLNRVTDCNIQAVLHIFFLTTGPSVYHTVYHKPPSLQFRLLNSVNELIF